MKKILKKVIALCLMVTLVAGTAISVNAGNASIADAGALADYYAAGSGTFTLTSNSRIYVVSSAKPTGDLLQTAQLVQRQFAADDHLGTGKLDLVWGPAKSAKAGDVVLKLNSSSSKVEGAEGYALEVSEKAVVIAKDTDGLLYGANMLQKYFRVAGGTSLSGFTAKDTPDTKERTVMLDTGRKYYTAEWICNFIRQISWMGYNTLQVHVSEDGGFRADFWDEEYYTENYHPENDFSWLCGSQVQSWVHEGYRKDPDAGKYLTTKELVKICEVAAEYHIDIVPSFDSPAHMDYITWKFEQNYKKNNNYNFKYGGTTYKASSTNGCINYTGRTGASTPTWPYYTTIDITDGTMARAFVFALYEDMADFFKEYAGSTDFSIGGDEVNLSSSYGPKWNYSQFPGYVNELNRMLNDKGYTCRMFNDFIGSTTYNQSADAKAVYEFDKNIEIMYWNSDFNPDTGKWTDPTWHVKFFWENNTGSEDNWGDGGRTMYNCIQTNTYYVLRVHTKEASTADARNPDNRNWTFYGTNEQDIYNKWYPADISEKGDKTENAADVPADQLGGAYFLIWNDYAAVSTESQVWNGAPDAMGLNKTYYLFDRMASNIIKMWNSDVNSTVTYNAFKNVRENYGYFPGFENCSVYNTLPTATEPERAYAADHTALQQAIGEKIQNTNGMYTAGSYAAYETAYDAAVTVNNNYDATEAEVNAAITALNDTKDALVDLTELRAALEANEKSNADGKYTADSFKTYEDAYAAAEQILADANATRDAIAKAINNLEAAVKGLTAENAPGAEDFDSENIKVELMARQFKSGKKVGFKVTTNAAVETLTVTDANGNSVELSTCQGKVQTVKVDGADKSVKIWLVKFAAPIKGEHTYIVSDGTEKESVKFVVN